MVVGNGPDCTSRAIDSYAAIADRPTGAARVHVGHHTDVTGAPVA
jgi:hypothetical protein